MQEQERRRRERQDLRIHFTAAEKIIIGIATAVVVEGDVVCVIVFFRFGDIDVVVVVFAAELRGGEVGGGGGGGLCDEAGAARPASRWREQRVFWR